MTSSDFSRRATRRAASPARLKPIGGAKDRAAGLVWRYRDENNYYVARGNALEDNVVLYRAERGKRTDLDPKGAGPFTYGKQVEVPVRAEHARPRRRGDLD